ncbi:MAG: type IV pilin N-terminal domain-containing protein [Halovenus sp.]
MTRAVSPVVGVVILVGLAVILSVSVGAVVTMDPPEPVPAADIELHADAEMDRIALRHHGGETLDTEDLRVSVRIDGEPLAEQPPVPFFAARGFLSGPSGPFNEGGDTTWRAGETAAFRLATTNDPALTPGATVAVTVSTTGGRVADLETTAG